MLLEETLLNLQLIYNNNIHKNPLQHKWNKTAIYNKELVFFFSNTL